MNIVVKAGLVLGVSVGLITLASGVTGMYKNPSLDTAVVIVFILIELGVLIWALRKTAVLKRYWGQVGTGTLIAVVGGVLVIVSSLLFTALFPDYKDVQLAKTADGWRDAGMSEEQIEQALPMAAAMMSPVPQALLGFVMTCLTGFVLSLIIAAFARKR